MSHKSFLSHFEIITFDSAAAAAQPDRAESTFKSLRLCVAELEAVCGSRISPPPPINNDSWSDGTRFEADRLRDGWSSFPSRAGALAQQAAFERFEWAANEPWASDLPFTLIPASLDGDGSTFSSKTTARLMTEDNQPIVVIGTRKNVEFGVSFGGVYGSGTPALENDVTSLEQLNGSEATYSDESEVTVTINIPNPTDAQKTVIAKTLEAINRHDIAIRSLHDNARIMLYDGSIVTGAELKALWFKTDFEINAAGFVYGQGTASPQTRGAANYNGGDPLIQANIDILGGYAASHDAGLNFWVGHEVGHLTAANRTHDGTVADAGTRFEQMANDISRAIAHSQGLAVLGPGDFETTSGTTYPRYSTPEPMIFVVPPAPGS